MNPLFFRIGQIIHKIIDRTAASCAQNKNENKEIVKNCVVSSFDSTDTIEEFLF